MLNRVLSYSALNGAISRAIFPWTRWEPATRRCGTRSSASRPHARRPRNSPSIAVRRGGFIVSTEAGKIADRNFSSDIGQGQLDVCCSLSRWEQKSESLSFRTASANHRFGSRGADLALTEL